MTDKEKDKNDRTRLSLLSEHNKSGISQSPLYSKIVKLLRIALPASAMIIILIVFSWDNVEDTIHKIEEIENSTPSIGQNELIEPRFETVDNNRNPFTITAKKAISDENDPDLIQMSVPLADMMMKDGAWLAIQSDDGTYWQKDQKLTLTGNVKIFHDLGYEISSQELNIDINKQTAYTKQEITAQGPTGSLHAKSMSADANIGNIIFEGPARLVLYNAIHIPQPE